MAEEENLQRLLRRSERVDETRIGDRVVLYHRDTATGIVLNPAGSRIWDSLSTPASAHDLIENTAKEHDTIPRERIAADVEGYVKALKEQQLVEDHT